MEHIHGGILCLLCKWISPPWSQAKGQKESPLSFIIAVYWNTLKHLRHRRREREKKRKDGFISAKKVNSRQMLASKRSQFFGGIYLFIFFWRLAPSGLVFVCGSVVLRPPYGEKLAGPLRGAAVIVTARCRITALEQVVIRVAEV